jgi:hypothetical protein
VTRTYNDVAQALSHYSSLSPRTDVYSTHIAPALLLRILTWASEAYENGVSALLLHISGTLPVLFRGTTYRFPIALWVPHAYPSEAPLVYVTPTEGMMVRPGQHVDPQGKIYHPYLAGFAEFDVSGGVLEVNGQTSDTLIEVEYHGFPGDSARYFWEGTSGHFSTTKCPSTTACRDPSSSATTSSRGWGGSNKFANSKSHRETPVPTSASSTEAYKQSTHILSFWSFERR